ncbi:MAG: adenosine deaminase [Actinomycetota bacterium]|nr:adenosine deaminase [Actinomycetota bacterium]
MSAPLDISAYISGLPKAELHVHLQGAASVATVLELAKRHPGAGIPTLEEDLRRFYTFSDFAHFIEVYIAVNELVRTADDVQSLVFGLGRDLQQVQVRYAEVTVTPDSHLLVGIAPEALSRALDDGRQQVLEQFGVELAWVFDIPGELGLESGVRTIEWAEQHLPSASVGFGLGGPEIGVPRSAFAEVFARARALGLASVPHAGETTGPETIRESLTSLGAVRIGHGIAAAQDAELMTELVEKGIVLEVCPTSNVCTRAVVSLQEHPFPVLREAGVRLTLNTDDPGMFDTHLNKEYMIAHEVFGLDAAELTELARESVRASFAGEDLRSQLLAEIDDYAQQSAS